ncbi:toprim domain-containing protein [Candidatus Saccharibacteria bacterium]|nr:toprim domain-containing protein [Candidatus Saccharibacteria bacterium]
MEKFNRNNIESMDIKQYLISKGVQIVGEVNGELKVHCLFGGCDEDSRGDEAHLYINLRDGVYYCQKCGAKGNKVTLAQHFDDWERLGWSDNTTANNRVGTLPNQSKPKNKEGICKMEKNTDINKFSEKLHLQLSAEAEEYLKNRGLMIGSIKYAKIGELESGGRKWLSIPIMKSANEVSFLKLRCWPGEEDSGPKYKNYPGGNESDLYGGQELLDSKSEEVLITEGEFDRLIARQNSLPFPVSSTAGAGTFKQDWLKYFAKVRKVYISLDNDLQGEKGTQKIIELFSQERPDVTINKITYPQGIKDMTDFFKKGYDADFLLEECSEYVGGPEPFDPTEFKEMGLEELDNILSSTIVSDRFAKCIVFLAMLTTYTENDQMNIYLIGPSASGKTHIMQEVAKYFPEEDIEMIAQASPTAFKHRKPIIDPENGKTYVDLERKLLLLQDVQNTALMETLRPLMSHDKKETLYLTTDRGKKSEFSCKESIIRGFATFIICSANSKMDEQESTRAIVLSPEVTKEKVKAVKEMVNRRVANPKEYEEKLVKNKGRQNLMERVRYIKSLKIESVIIPNPDLTLTAFNQISNKNQAGEQRDIAHFNSLVKAAAMLNAARRMDDYGNIIVKEEDIDIAVELWSSVSKSAETGLPLYIYDFYRNYVLAAYKDKNNGTGITRMEICEKYFSIHREALDDYKLRKEIIPTLKLAKAIKEVVNESDKKTKLIIPLIDID